MIRTLRDEVERYGHYSLAAESMYDHPFQWVEADRAGPRPRRRYSDQWHAEHMINPRAVVPESIMPGYRSSPRRLEYADVEKRLEALRAVGVPYSDEMIATAKADLEAQMRRAATRAKLVSATPKAKVGDFDGKPGEVAELDAVIAYLQMLGTLVDFANFDASGPNLR